MTGRNLFRGLAGLLVLGAVLHVATLWPRVAILAAELGPRAWIVFLVFGLVATTALAAGALAGFLLWRVPDRSDARALTLFLGFLAFFWGSLFRFVQIAYSSEDLSVTINYGGGWISDSALASFVFTLAAFVSFSAVFPRPLAPRLPPPRRFDRPHRLRVAARRPRNIWGAAVLAILAVNGVPAIVFRLTQSQTVIAVMFAAVILVLAACAVAAMVLGARNLRLSYRTASAEERDRVLWVVTGFSVASWALIASAALVALSASIGHGGTLAMVIAVAVLLFAPLLVVVSAAVGILYAGAIDPALVLRRSTAYGFLGAIGLIAFTVLETALSELVERWVDLPGFVGPLLAGLLVTLALIPVRAVLKRRFQPLDERGTEDAGYPSRTTGHAGL
jgi:hypothetical protein